MKKYNILLILMVLIILGVTFTVISPEFYEPIEQYPRVLQYSEISEVAKEDIQMKKLYKQS